MILCTLVRYCGSCFFKFYRTSMANFRTGMKIINFILLSNDGHGLIVVVLSLIKNKFICNESHLEQSYH